MRYAPRALLAGGLGFAASFVVACGGGSGLLTADQANSLNSQLDQVSTAFDSGQCVAVASAATGLTNAVDNLTGSVKPSLVDNLRQGATTVQALATKQCHRQSTTTPTTPTVTTASTPTTATQSTPTQSTASTPTPTPPTSSTATSSTPSGTTSTGGTGGAGIGGGNGGGNGGGSGGAGTGNGNGNGP